jgi:flavin reductase (DIM6/NTAB) family NADH-FMN oxidoreductase RutF
MTEADDMTAGLSAPSADEFRHVIGHFASGVAVVTASDETGDYGTTVSSLCSLSVEPPRLIVCMNRTSSTGQVLTPGGWFGLNILAEDQHDLARLFATKGTDKFRDLSVSRGPHGTPVLDGALAVLECQVISETDGGTHAVLIGEVGFSTAAPGAPLVYHRGAFGAFADSLGD